MVLFHCLAYTHLSIRIPCLVTIIKRALYAFERHMWGVGPITTNDTPIMGSLSVCLCAWVALSVCLFHQKPARFYSYVTCIEVCDAAYCYSVPHSLCICAFSATCTVYFYWWHTYYGQSVCLSVSLVCLYVCHFYLKPAHIYPLFLYMYRICDAAYCYSVPHTVVCLSDFRHRYQHRSRRLLLHILHMLGEASYFPYV